MNNARRPLLSIVSVVFNDPDGLDRTIESARELLLDGAEMWVIDGSSDQKSREHTQSIAGPSIYKVIEPDSEIYDAMNKGAARATGSYIIFMNAGDIFAPGFTEHFSTFASAMQQPDGSSGSERVILGYGIETFAGDYYLRPKRGQESRSFRSPMHQATFYPREVFSKWRFDTKRPVGADGALTRLALQHFGGIFIPVVICVFELGGASSSYGDIRLLRARWTENSASGKAKLLTKALLYHLVSHRNFYRLLALRISDRVAGPTPDVREGYRITRQGVE